MWLFHMPSLHQNTPLGTRQGLSHFNEVWDATTAHKNHPYNPNGKDFFINP